MKFHNLVEINLKKQFKSIEISFLKKPQKKNVQFNSIQVAL